jgi:hypothetical protein
VCERRVFRKILWFMRVGSYYVTLYYVQYSIFTAVGYDDT